MINGSSSSHPDKCCTLLHLCGLTNGRCLTSWYVNRNRTKGRPGGRTEREVFARGSRPPVTLGPPLARLRSGLGCGIGAWC
jgi:hypothetical protein